MNSECQELKVKVLDQSNQEMILEIKLALGEMKELRKEMDCLGTEHTKVTENLRELRNSHKILETKHSKVTETLKSVQVSHTTFETEVSEEVKILKDTIPWNIKGTLRLRLVLKGVCFSVLK